MAGYISGDTRKVTTHRLVEMKQRGEKISMLTSYDYTTAQIVDGAGIDVILVGDSASNVMAEVTADMPEGAVAEVTADADGAVTGNLQAAQKNDSMDEKQRSQPAVSGNEASGAEDSMEEAEQDQEETLIEKQNSPSLEKMKTKGQQ